MKRMPALTTALFAALIFSACGSPPKDRFYVLRGADAPPAAGNGAYTLAITSVSVPDLVDRPQLVVYQGASQVQIVEHERWAEPLKTSVAGVIARDLRAQLPDVRIAVYPEASVMDANCRLSVDVQRLELRRKESATVDALWSLKCMDGKPKHGRSFSKEMVGDDSYDALTAGLGRALAQVAKDVGQEVGKLPTKP
jgi:uncharacterized protein